MKLFNYEEAPLREAEEGARGVKVRWLIASETGAENFYMRLFEVSAGGWTPLHSHPWEHEIFVLEGNGIAQGSSDEKAFGKGDVIFIPSGELHQIRNSGSNSLKFLCLIPSERLKKE
jgi:quercetin dioxygenase-like cupin family protein